jgi:hypothetical protein
MYVLALDGGEWLGSCHDHFAPEKSRKCPVNRRLGGLRYHSVSFGEENDLLSLLGFAPQISLNVVGLVTDLPLLHTTPAHCPLGESDTSTIECEIVQQRIMGKSGTLYGNNFI